MEGGRFDLAERINGTEKVKAAFPLTCRGQGAIEPNRGSTDLSSQRQMVHLRRSASRTARTCRGQGATEFIAIMAMGLLIVLVIITVATQRLVDLSNQKVTTEARSGVKDLADAANEVYKQGYGARKNVFFTIPTDTDFDRSYIGVPPGASTTVSRTINLNVKDTDITALTDGPVSGAFPRASGGRWLKVESKGSFVSIGSYFLQLDSGSLYVSMQNDSHTNASVLAYNAGNETISITTSVSWTNYSTGVNMTLAWLNATIPQGANSNASFNFTFDSGYRTGVYSGSIVFFANTTSGGTAINESITLPVTVEITTSPFYPAFNNATINLSTVLLMMFINQSNSTITIGKNVSGGPQNNREMTLFVCAQPGTNISNVSVYSLNYSQSSFYVGSQPWYTGPINPNACLSRVVNFTSSLSAVTGSSAETIAATATNGSTYAYYYTASVGVNVSIDADRPNVTNASHSPAYPQAGVQVTMHANITDSGGAPGQSWIENCTAWVNGTAYSMAPNDGSFNTASEGANISMTPANDGTYPVNISCNDSMGNYATNRSFNFIVDSAAPIIASMVAGCGSQATPCASALNSSGDGYIYYFTPGQAIYINASANDSATGNEHILDCTFSVNGTAASGMNATDGAYDSSFEWANGTLGILATGTNNLTINCTDVHGNTRTNYSQLVPATVCSTLDIQGHTYGVGADLHTTGSCFNVTNSSITLDCHGYTITGENATGSWGVYANGTATSNPTSFTLQNCNIANFTYGVLINGTPVLGGLTATIQNSILNSSGAGCVGAAIWFEKTFSSIINDTNAIAGDTYAFRLVGQNANTLAVDDSNFTNTGSCTAAYIDGFDYPTITDSNFLSTTAIGLYCACSYANVSSINATSYGGAASFFTAGILTGTSANVVSDSYFYTNNSNSYAFYFGTGTFNVMDNCTVTSTQGSALQIYSSSTDNIIENSTFYAGGGGANISVYPTTARNNFSYNNITAPNGGIGVKLFSGSVDNRFSHNTITASTSNFAYGTVWGTAQADRNTFINNTITQLNSSSNVIKLTTVAPDNYTFTNNTFIASGGTGVGITQTITNGYHLFTGNNFTGASVWINSTLAAAYFNDSTRGNIYYLANGSASWDIFDITTASPPGWATAGTSRPFNATTVGGNITGIGNCSDWHPWTNKTTP